jgi:hypothetical protein
MTNRLAVVVEGHGEVAAAPVLLRRLAAWLTPEEYVDISHPIRVNRDKFVRKDDEFRRHILLASGKCGQDGWVLIILDADDDCPATFGAELLARARAVVPGQRISVVLANREFEAWFIAAAESLHGCRGFQLEPNPRIEPENPRNAKGWMADRMRETGYGEVTDQPAFCGLFDLDKAHERSRSFRKLCSEWSKNIGI